MGIAVACQAMLVPDGSIQKFMDYLEFTRHFSEHTKRSYLSDLRLFCCFLSGIRGDERPLPRPKKLQEKLFEVEPKDISNYLKYLECGNYASPSIIRKLATLRSFYRFLLKFGWVDRNPAKQVKGPVRTHEVPKFMTEEQTVKLLNAPRIDKTFGFRDKAMLQITYAASLRIDELVKLNLQDLDIVGRILYIRRPGRLERMAPIGFALAAISRYLEFRLEFVAQKPSQSDALFLNHSGDRLSARGFRRKFQKYLIEARLDPTLSPKSLRHSHAIHNMRRGVSIKDTVRDLRLRSESCTKQYVNV